jgi:hypothetical protein
MERERDDAEANGFHYFAQAIQREIDMVDDAIAECERRMDEEDGA